tara:strand:- start:248 stop:496 length:249 start_codon:yes stop_codon:yes gene_type:complete
MDIHQTKISVVIMITSIITLLILFVIKPKYLNIFKKGEEKISWPLTISYSVLVGLLSGVIMCIFGKFNSNLKESGFTGYAVK